MFNSKYRYAFIFLLGMYSYLNTLFTEVHTYYGINAPWYAVMLSMLLITLLIWEGNRLFLNILKRRFGNQGLLKFLFLFLEPVWPLRSSFLLGWRLLLAGGSICRLPN